MEIKGTAVKSIPEFVKQKYTNEYLNWVKSLSPESQKIINEVSSAGWYGLKHAAIEPSQKVCTLFFGNDVKKAKF